MVLVSQTLSELDGLLLMLAIIAAKITITSATMPIILAAFFILLLLFRVTCEIFFIYYCNICFLAETF